MGNCVVCCDVQPAQIAGDDYLGLRNYIARSPFHRMVEVRRKIVPEVDCEAAESATAAPSPFLGNQGGDLGGEIVIGSLECKPMVVQSRSPRASSHHPLDDQVMETICDNSQTMKTTAKWGPYISPSEYSEFTQNRACTMCQKQLCGAVTIGMCGHIFHQQCIEKWRRDVCPYCQKSLDEKTEGPVDSTGAPVLPNGTPIMLQGLTVRSTMNGTYAKIINYSERMGRYTIWHKASSGLYRVKSVNVVSILLE